MTPIENLSNTTKRVYNIIKNDDYDEIYECMLLEEDEIILYKELKIIENIIETPLREGHLRYYLVTTLLLSTINKFLDNVKIHVNIESIRQNRISLLRKSYKLLTLVADATKL
jgi:glycyl-tRNA synthetase beta subunit